VKDTKKNKQVGKVKTSGKKSVTKKLPLKKGKKYEVEILKGKKMNKKGKKPSATVIEVTKTVIAKAGGKRGPKKRVFKVKK